jgi:hypothetical protein
MAIGAMQGAAVFYDFNRDMYYSERDRYEREMHFRLVQEEEYRRMQNAAYSAPEQKQVNSTPKPDPKDPLSFLSKADTKILLTGAST